MVLLDMEDRECARVGYARLDRQRAFPAAIEWSKISWPVLLTEIENQQSNEKLPRLDFEMFNHLAIMMMTWNLEGKKEVLYDLCITQDKIQIPGLRFTSRKFITEFVRRGHDIDLLILRSLHLDFA